MTRPGDLFDFKEWQEHLTNVLDDQFPKGKCKQRGNALVLYAEFQIFISCIMKDIEQNLQRIKKIQEDVNVLLNEGGQNEKD